jgi:hypothetical protein
MKNNVSSPDGINSALRAAPLEPEEPFLAWALSTHVRPHLS